ncbi:MAG TPA: hypothetical protein VKU39_06835 [Streptosporangiaceae bacterium]|nr:hypothetical protein [Streptosporangiaceae bacterium]
MLVTNHVLSGALIGALVRRPVPAFLLGVASHFALDMVPHYGDPGVDQRTFLKVAVPDGLAGLAAIAILATAAAPAKRTAVLAGMAGAALPDLDKPSKLWFGRSPWPEAVNHFHGAIQNEAPERFTREMATIAAFATVSLAAVVRDSRGPRGSRGRRVRPCREA